MITYGAAAGTIDLGNDPPMVIGEEEEVEETPIPRAVSWRWMTGTVLTGVTSILLMGAALTVALNNPNQFASLPDSFATVMPDIEGLVFGRKADRVRPVEEQISNRMVLQVSTVTRQGDRDFIKLKPFARVRASLSTASTEIASQVPPYDALRIFADTTEIETPTPAPTTTIADADQVAAATAAATNGEVAITMVDFPIANPDLETTVALNTAEVEQIVRASAGIGGSEGGSGDGDMAMAYADPSLDAGNPLAASDVTIVPENVSSVPKSTDAILEETMQEKVIAVAKSENLRTLFRDNAIVGDDANEIIAALSQLVDVSRLRPGQKIRVAFESDPGASVDAALPDSTDGAKEGQSALRPMRVSIYDDGAHQATVARADNNAFVRADEPSALPSMLADAEPKEEEVPSPGGPPKLYDAVYQTALEQQVPAPLIDQIIKVFAYDVDFQSRIAPGDSMEIFHSLPEPGTPEAAEPEILFASLTLGGIPKRFYRFRTPDDAVVDYYDEEGKSAKKFLMRKPMTTGVVRSNYGWRVHPILGYRRLHAGTDYAAPKGTPIFAAGNGVVVRAGRSSGYGNLTVVRHTNGYETAYAHQSAFAKGIAPGVSVRQGQVIGYVGSTGLSTGPHLHFEIRVNGKPVDPLRIRLPRGRVLEGDYLVAFEKERQRIDTLLGNGASTVPQKIASATGQ
jgi:murein DD-endopeptidase MepM/ murein hydrolase activator NlpD